MIPGSHVAKLSRALPFWASLLLVPLALIGANYGGWTVLLPAFGGWTTFILLDFVTGKDEENADLETTDDQLFWYKLITLIWFPIQFVLLFGMIWYVSDAQHLRFIEKFGLFFGMGVITGTIGINYSHELMHQNLKWNDGLGICCSPA